MEEEGKFYFCTSSMKNIYKQLKTVPYIEYSILSKDMVSVRISGKVCF